MIRIGTALVFAVLASAALGQATAAPQSDAETPKAPPTVGGLFQLSTRAPPPVLISTNTPAATGSRTIQFLVTRCAGFVIALVVIILGPTEAKSIAESRVEAV